MGLKTADEKRINLWKGDCLFPKYKHYSTPETECRARDSQSPHSPGLGVKGRERGLQCLRYSALQWQVDSPVFPEGKLVLPPQAKGDSESIQ